MPSYDELLKQIRGNIGGNYQTMLAAVKDAAREQPWQDPVYMTDTTGLTPDFYKDSSAPEPTPQAVAETIPAQPQFIRPEDVAAPTDDPGDPLWQTRIGSAEEGRADMAAMLQQGQDMGNSFIGGVQGGVSNVLDAGGFVSDSLNADGLSKWFYDHAADWQQDAAARQAQVANPDYFINRVINGTGSSLPMMAPSLAIGGLASAVGLGGIFAPIVATTLGASEAAGNAGQLYRQLMAEGRSYDEAKNAANRLFWTEAPIDVASEHFLGMFGPGLSGKLGGMTSRIVPNAVIRNMIGEGFQEGAQETWQGIMQQAAQNAAGKNFGEYLGELGKEGKNFLEYFKREGAPAVVSGALTAGLGGMGGLPNNTQIGRLSPQQKQTVSNIQKVNEAVAAAQQAGHVQTVADGLGNVNSVTASVTAPMTPQREGFGDWNSQEFTPSTSATQTLPGTVAPVQGLSDIARPAEAAPVVQPTQQPIPGAMPTTEPTTPSGKPAQNVTASNVAKVGEAIAQNPVVQPTGQVPGQNTGRPVAQRGGVDENGKFVLGSDVANALRELAGINDSEQAQTVKEPIQQPVIEEIGIGEFGPMYRGAEGEQAVDHLMNVKQGEVISAMRDPRLGENDGIDFVWGIPGDPNKRYRGGYGLAHIVAKHGPEAVALVPKIIREGSFTYDEDTNSVIYLSEDGKVVLQKQWHGNPKNWVLTSYTPNINKDPRPTREVQAGGLTGEPLSSPGEGLQGEPSGIAGSPHQDGSTGNASVPASGNQTITQPTAAGNPIKIVTPDGNTEIDAHYAVVPAESLTASNTADLTINPDFPAQFQPRDRSNAESMNQINAITRRLDPARLTESRLTSEGAPIVDANGIVESGNGRTLALMRGYRGNAATMQAYRQYLIDNAAKFGLDPAQIAQMNNPVLVRVRDTPMTDAQRVAFATESNTSSIAGMSATETARIDAGRLTSDILTKYDPNLQPDAAGQREFHKAFLASIPQNEHNTLIKDGRPTQALLQRERNALVYAATGDEQLAAHMTESTDDNVRTVSQAIVQVAPTLARINAEMQTGRLRSEYSLGKDLADAANWLSELRANGEKAADHLNQLNAFSELDHSEETKLLLAFFDQNKRASKIGVIRNALLNYANSVESLGSPDEQSLFDDVTPPAKIDLLRAALDRAMSGEGKQGRLFSEGPSARDYSVQKNAPQSAERQNNYVVARNIREVREALRPQRGRIFTNRATETEATFGTDQIEKMVSAKARRKSEANGFTYQDHYAAAANVGRLFEEAQLGEVHGDKNNSPDVLSIKRFYAPFDTSQGEAIVKLTVKEIKREGHKIYSVEVLEIEKPQTGTLGQSNTKAEPTPAVSGNLSLSQQSNESNTHAEITGPTLLENRKVRQLELLQKTNPMHDNYHTGVRDVSDIHSASEVWGSEDEFAGTPDWTFDKAQGALAAGKVTVYSSSPIQPGAFVTPSQTEAKNYAGNGKVYSKTVSVDDVAWIDDIEGQLAPVRESRDYSVQKNAPHSAGRRMKKPKYFEVSEEVRQREAEHNAKSGAEAIQRVLDRSSGVTVVQAAMHDSRLGEGKAGDIDIVWGEAGTAERNYSDGFGLAHIIAKHGKDILPRITEIVTKGELQVRKSKKDGHITRAYYQLGDEKVVLRHYHDARAEFFVITAYEDTIQKNTNVHSDGIQARVGQLAEKPSSLHERSSVPSLSQSLPSSNTHAEITGPALQKRGEGWGSGQWSDKDYSVERDYATAAPVPATPVQNEADKKLALTRISDIMNKLRKIRPVRQGVDAPKSVLGYTDQQKQIARHRWVNDWMTAAHEIGHIVDYKLKLRDKVANSAQLAAMQQELEALGVNSSPPNSTPEYLRKEGIAEYFRQYAIAPDMAELLAPEYTKLFKDALETDAELKKLVEDVFETARAYEALTPEQKLRAGIRQGDETTARPKNIWEAVKNGWEKFRTEFDDGLRRIEKLQNVLRDRAREAGKDTMLQHGELKDEFAIYDMLRTAPGFMGKAKRDVQALIEPVRKIGTEAYDSLISYMKAKRALNYWENKMEPGIGLTWQQTQDFVKQFEAEHADLVDISKKIRQAYADMVHNTMIDAGVWTEAQYQEFVKKWPDYVPFMRVDEDGHIQNPGKPGGKKVINLSNQVKRTKGVGSEHAFMAIEDPFESMVKNAMLYHKIAEKNRVGQALMNAARADPALFADLIEPVKGGEVSGKNTFYVWENGHKQYFAADKDIIDALATMEAAAPDHLIAKVATKASNALKLGATRANPAFIITNFVRDATYSTMTNSGWGVPFYNTVKGLLMQNSSDPKVQQQIADALDHGIAYSGITELDMNTSRESVARAVKKAIGDDSFFTRLQKAFDMTLGKVGGLNEMIEVAPKFAEYQRLVDQGYPKRYAARMAREVNLDFSRGGTIGKDVNRYIAFFNPAIQGVSKMTRTAVANPGKFLAKTALYVMLPSIISWAMGHDDDEYKRLSRNIKDRYWVFKAGGAWIRVAKPDLVGLVGSAVERILDNAADRNPAAFRNFGTSIGEAVFPSYMPTLLSPLLEHWGNKSFFYGETLIPNSLENLPAEMQYRKETSSMAKFLGKMWGISPIVIDNYIKGYSGGVGEYVTKIPDMFIKPQEEARKFSERPIVSRFTVDPYRSSESISRFYDLKDQTTIAKNGFKAMAKQGERGEISRDVRAAKMFEKAGKRISDLNKDIARIREAQGMTPEKKRERIDRIQLERNRIAEHVLAQYDAMK